MSSSDRNGEWKLECKVYVGDLGYGATKEELEDVFSRHGTLRNVWIARNPPGFAFVEFEDYRDAEDACKALDGTRINGRKARVEMSSGKSRWKYGPPTRDGWHGGFRDDWESKRGRYSKNTDCHILVEDHIPPEEGPCPREEDQHPPEEDLEVEADLILTIKGQDHHIEGQGHHIEGQGQDHHIEGHSHHVEDQGHHPRDHQMIEEEIGRKMKRNKH